jgi:hypothetical protein
MVSSRTFRFSPILGSAETKKKLSSKNLAFSNKLVQYFVPYVLQFKFAGKRYWEFG